ncbi:gamma-butyrobetaine hydroxylase-like domain-containing protein [Pseudomonas laurylsulfatiphila]
MGFTSAGYRVALAGDDLQRVFSDGHERGIYPWAYLAQLIP